MCKLKIAQHVSQGLFAFTRFSLGHLVTSSIIASSFSSMLPTAFSQRAHQMRLEPGPISRLVPLAPQRAQANVIRSVRLAISS